MPDQRTSADLERENAELRAAGEALKEFVAVAAHELRGPMSAILGYAATMRRRWDHLRTEEREEFLAVIERRSRYLTRLLDGLLTVSKIEAGALDVRAERLDVARIIEHSLEDVHDRSQIVVRCPPELKVTADPDHLQRILLNYIRNAQRYGRPPIEVEAGGDGEWVVISVVDHGDGVSEGFAARLFEKFARGQVEPSERGTGLGLSIVRGLARAAGGDAWYEPNRPQGSRFLVRLPSEGL